MTDEQIRRIKRYAKQELEKLRGHDVEQEMISRLAHWAAIGWGYNHRGCSECPAKEVCNKDCERSFLKMAIKAAKDK